MSLRDVKSLYIHVNVLYIHPFMAFGDTSETQISKPWRPAINRTQEVRLALCPALKNVLEPFVADHLSLTGFSFHASGNQQLNLGPSKNIPAAFCRPPLGGLVPVEVWGLDRTCTHTLPRQASTYLSLPVQAERSKSLLPLCLSCVRWDVHAEDNTRGC